MHEIVAYTHLSQSTIRRAVARAELKCSRRTGKYLFKLDQVDKWLE